MKKLCIVLALGLILQGFAANKTILAAEASNVRDPAAMEDIIFLYMSGSIYEAIENHYKEPRQYLKPVLLSISRLPNSTVYEVVYTFETFTGAHNPPYGKDTVTFWVYDGGTWVKEYKHAEILGLNWWWLIEKVFVP